MTHTDPLQEAGLGVPMTRRQVEAALAELDALDRELTTRATVPGELRDLRERRPISGSGVVVAVLIVLACIGIGTALSMLGGAR